jgi:hypothetical protein
MPKIRPMQMARKRKQKIRQATPEELEHRIAADTRKAILDEEMEQSRIAGLLH